MNGAWMVHEFRGITLYQVDQSNNLTLSLQNRLAQWVNTLADTEQSNEHDDGDQYGTET